MTNTHYLQDGGVGNGREGKAIGGLGDHFSLQKSNAQRNGERERKRRKGKILFDGSKSF